MVDSVRGARTGEWVEMRCMVKERLVEAAANLPRVRAGGGVWPAGYRCAMPDVVRSVWDAYGQEKTRDGIPPPRAIDEMWEAIDWLNHIGDAQTRKIVWARSAGVPGTHVARRWRCSRRTVLTRYNAGVTAIARALLKKKKEDAKKQLRALRTFG